MSKEPVLTVAVLNEIFKSQEHVDVFELPYSVEHTSDDQEEDSNEDESNGRPPNLMSSMERGLSISPMPRGNKALELANITDDYHYGGTRNYHK